MRAQDRETLSPTDKADGQDRCILREKLATGVAAFRYHYHITISIHIFVNSVVCIYSTNARRLNSRIKKPFLF